MTFVTDEQKKKALLTIPFVLLPASTPAKRIANGSYRAVCPFHDDTVPSMSVRKSETGDWTFRCFACGAKGDSITFAMKYLGLGYGEAVAALLGELNERPRIVAKYDYVRVDGSHAYQVVRYVPKDFRIRHKTESGWQWDMKDEDGRDIDRIIYKLPWIAQQPRGATVFYVEGEKDVESMEARGFVATTHAGGAEAFRSEYIDQIPRHCRVVVVPDNDEAGKKLMRVVWAKTKLSGHACGFVVLPERLSVSGAVPVDVKDVTNYFAAGGSDEPFLAAMDGHESVHAKDVQ